MGMFSFQAMARVIFLRTKSLVLTVVRKSMLMAVPTITINYLVLVLYILIKETWCPYARKPFAMKMELPKMIVKETLASVFWKTSVENILI